MVFMQLNEALPLAASTSSPKKRMDFDKLLHDAKMLLFGEFVCTSPQCLGAIILRKNTVFYKLLDA